MVKLSMFVTLGKCVKIQLKLSLLSAIARPQGCFCLWAFFQNSGSKSLPQISLLPGLHSNHYYDVIMGAMAYQIISLTIVYSNIYSGADQRKHQSSACFSMMTSSNGNIVRVTDTGEFPAQRASNADDIIFDDVIMYDNLQGCSRVCHWLPLRCLPSWINHLLPRCWFTPW